MGFDASMTCKIELKDKTIKSTRQFEKLIGYDDDAMWELFDDWEIKDGFLEGESVSKYWEDRWYEFLENIKDKVVIGTVFEFTGEDWSQWRFELKPDGEWYEESGTVHVEYDEGHKIEGGKNEI